MVRELTAGGRLKQAIHIARARTEITADTQLALAAGVHYDTLMNWYGDRTVPRPAEIRKVATVLGVPYGDLMAAYEGTDPLPQPVGDALADLVAVLRENVEESRAARAQQAEAVRALVAMAAALRGAPVPELPPSMYRPTRRRA